MTILLLIVMALCRTLGRMKRVPLGAQRIESED